MTSLYPAVDASSAPSREKTRFAVALLALFLFAAATTAENAAYAVYPADEPTATEASGPASDETASADSNEKKQEAQWFRLQYENNAPVELQTSIVRFDGEFTTSEGQTNPVSVDLIGAIHLADAAYYEQLNKAFAEYDVVVFELVAPKGTDIKALVEEERAAKEKAKEEKGKERIDPLDFISFSQVAMSRMLDMVYQMDGVDYAADNLRRGGMCPQITQPDIASIDTPRNSLLLMIDLSLTFVNIFHSGCAKRNASTSARVGALGGRPERPRHLMAETAAPNCWHASRSCVSR